MSPEEILRGIIDGSLTELVDENATGLAQYRLCFHDSLETISLKKATWIGNPPATYNNSLKILVMPKATGAIPNMGYRNNPLLEKVDLINNGFTNFEHFAHASKLKTIILRRASGVPTLANINTFTNTPFRNGGGVELSTFRRPFTNTLETALRSITKPLRTGPPLTATARSLGRRLKALSTSITTQTVLPSHKGQGVMVYG